MKTPKRKITTLKQICKLIPGHLVDKLAAKYKIDARKFSPWSHIVSLLYAQLAHSLSLNDICDALANHAALSDIRGATPPKRNTLSNANRTRDAGMAEALFWGIYDELRRLAPNFGMGRGYSGLPRRFKRTINAIDSTTIQLFANCLDWAKHRRRKAAAKMHLCLNLQTFLPRFVVADSAKGHDSTKAMSLCSVLKAGEIAIFDKAYIKFDFLSDLTERGVFWVGRAKDNMDYVTMGQHSAPKGDVVRDERIKLAGPASSKKYPGELRLVEAYVEVKGRRVLMAFITNNFDWKPMSIADLYKSRWGIELFFKEVKQNLKLADFIGYNENAVLWQIWMAMVAYLLLRFIEHVSGWTHSSFNRLFTVLRGVLWSYVDMWGLLDSYGTASGPTRLEPRADCAWQMALPGIET